MKKTLLTAVSAVAILGAGSFATLDAHAADTKVETKAGMNTTVGPGDAESASKTTGNIGDDAAKAWDQTKKDASEAAEKVSEAAEDTYNDVKEALDDDNTASMAPINVDQKMTAAGMIGQPVYNAKGERVAKIKDIILDQNGNAQMVVLADGDFTGLGKTVAYDYSILTKRSADGDVIAPISEEMIDKAANFSYDPQEKDEKVRVMPSTGYSVAAILDGELVNPAGETLGNIDNVVFRNAHAAQIVVGYGGVAGVGEKQAAISFEEADLVRNGDSIDFKLSANEAKEFTAYQKTAVN